MSAVKQNLNKLQQQILSQPSVRAGQDWYKSQSPRDQLIVKSLGGFVLLCLFVLIFVQPMIASEKKYQQQLNKSLALYEKLASNAHRFGSGSSSSSSGAPVMAVTTQVAKQYNLNLKRFEPDNDDLRIWLENVSFDSAIAFVEELNRKHGVIIKQINTERSDQPGRVNLRATLGR